MKIYAIKKNYQGYDMDCWNHWIESTIILYCLTREIAEAHIDLKLFGKPVVGGFVWDSKLGDGRNIIEITENPNGKKPYTKCHLYYIVEIDVLES